jgi:branched-chain amino acid aminotransferase
MNVETMNTMTDGEVRPGFGTIMVDHMVVATYADGVWTQFEVCPTEAIPMHPGAHVLHYASTCFEGFKAYRGPDGRVAVFRLERHIERMHQSARALALPQPGPGQLDGMVRALIDRTRTSVPEAPGALYLRPLLFGTTPAIGGATIPPTEAMLVLTASPVWDYFAEGPKPLRLLVDDQHERTAPHMGKVKAGANYASALVPTLAARQVHKADQVLFCPNGQVQETGVANLCLFKPRHVLTPGLADTFLHGVTRDSLLTLARADGYRVEERPIDIEELLAWVPDGEAALAGTAAVLAGVGTLLYRGKEHRVGSGSVGSVTRELRSQLIAIQHGHATDRFGWLTPV